MPEPQLLPTNPLAGAPIRTVTATIPAGQSLSNAVDLSQGTAVLIYMPSGWTPALLSFQVSPDNVDFYDLVDATAREITLNIAPKTTAINPLPPLQLGWLKFRSGSRLRSVAQVEARTIIISYK